MKKIIVATVSIITVLLAVFTYSMLYIVSIVETYEYNNCRKW